MKIIQTKKVDNSLEITRQPETPLPVKQNYTREYVEEHLANLIKSRDEAIAIKDAEIQEYQNILAEMDSLGIIKAVKEII